MNLYKKIKLAPTPPILKGIIALLVMAGLLVSQAPVVAQEPLALEPLDGVNYKLTLSGGDTVTLGDVRTGTFDPYITLKRWDGEVWLKVELAGEILERETELEIQGDKIKTKYKIKYGEIEFEYEVELYPLEPARVEGEKVNELGGIEYELIFQKAPPINVIAFDIETNGLDFFYQPPLTQAEIEEGSYRPENVVGSYAVYHSTKRDYMVGETNYMAGKAFHIYRPKIIDALGNWAWGEININKATGSMVITIPQDFLTNATYPIRLDPNFGYETKGGTSYTYIEQGRTLVVTQPASGTVQSYSLYLTNSDGSNDGRGYGLYAGSATADPITRLDYSLEGSGTVDDWDTLNSTTGTFELDGSAGHLFAHVDHNASPAMAGYYDSGDPNEMWTSAENYVYPPLTPVDRVANYDRKLSIYCTYSEDGVSAPTVVTNPATSVEETTATLSGNITATGGENCTDRGFQWDIDSGVPYSSNWTEAGDFGISNFTHGITSLTKGELYYYRAGANNTAGWGWGSEVTFLTKPDEPTSLTDTARTAAQITLTWTLGSGSDNTTIRYRTDQYPTDYNDGTLGYGGTASTCNVTGLSAGQIYYFRAWSWCSEGALEQWSDTYSQDTGYTLPGDPTNLATSNAQKTSLDLDWTKGVGDNLTMVRGQTGSYPTGVGDGDQIYYDSGNSTTDSGLDANTTYYYRAWAYDSESGYYSASYSQDTGTTAMPDAPTVTTGNATVVTDTTATLNGNITDTGDQNADTRGFEWGLSTGNYSDNWTEVGSYGTGAFSHGLTLLSANTTYYARAMAHNDGGWGYGGEIDFTTLAETALPPGTPTGLTLIDLGGITIDASWSAGAGNTTSFLLLVDRDGYPDSANQSLWELAYSGNLSSANLTGFDLDDNVFYFSLWGYNANGYSENYTTASIGTGIDWLAFITEGDMETLAEVLGDFLLIAVVAGISILAYWHRDRLLYVLAGLALMSYAALQWGENIYIGLILIVLGLYTFAKAAWGARRA